jgi:hypothetical protein
VANKILLSAASFVLWKSAIVCAFFGTFCGFYALLQGNALEKAWVCCAPLARRPFSSTIEGILQMRNRDTGKLSIHLESTAAPLLGQLIGEP